MKYKTFFSFQFVMILVASVCGLLQSISFTAIPSDYTLGLTPNIDMQCLFQRDGISPGASVMSIHISVSNVTDTAAVSKFIASINEIEGHAHSISHDASTVSGAIDNTNGQSFLQVSFGHPTADLEGVYTCVVYGFDENGIPFTVSNSTRIREVKPDLSGLVSSLKKMDVNISSLQEIIIDLQSRLRAMRESFFYTSSVYSGHRYYMAIDMDHFTYSEAKTMCALHGGYLVELDDREEFVFVRDFIQQINVKNNYTIVMTGATDEEHEGVWVNKHNTNASLSFDWAAGKPGNDRGRNCQNFGKVGSVWFLLDSSCDFFAEYHHNSFICEVSESEDFMFET